MNSNWLATLQTLGFDIMLIAIVALIILNAVEPILHRWRDRVRARELQKVPRGFTTHAQQPPAIDATEAPVAEAPSRARRPEWLAGAMKGLPTRYDKPSPGTPADESTPPPGRRAA